MFIITCVHCNLLSFLEVAEKIFMVCSSHSFCVYMFVHVVYLILNPVSSGGIVNRKVELD